MLDPPWLSVIPPLVAILMAILTRQVILSLGAGIFMGWLILSNGNPAQGLVSTLDCMIDVFSEAWRTKVLIFTLLVGSLLVLIQVSGGLDGFIAWISRWRWSQTRRGAQLMAWLVGLGVFIESNITCLVVGTVSRPLFDRLRLSREKLAYLCDATSAPVCSLLPINGWGALLLGLISAQASQGYLEGRGSLSVFLSAMPFNLYAIFSVLVALVIVLLDRDFGPMKKAEKRAREEGKPLRDGAMPVVDAEVLQIERGARAQPRLLNMLVPLGVLVTLVPIGIFITGWQSFPAGEKPFLGDMTGWLRLLDQSSGSTAVFWGVCGGVAIAALLAVVQKSLSIDETVKLILKGAGGVMPLAVIMMLAFALGMTCDALGTGGWVAQQVSDSLPPLAVAPILFLTAGFMAFATGTSWGTFTIMIPLAIPLASMTEQASVSMAIGAVISGGVFGDHCSPISDTTVVSSMAACSDHIDHVRTQFPYALLAGLLTLFSYIILGALGVASS